MAGVSGHGVIVNYDTAAMVVTDGDVPTWASIACLAELGDLPRRVRNSATYVCHDDPNADEIAVATTRSPENGSFTTVLDTSLQSHADLLDSYDNGTIYSWQIILPDNGNYTVQFEGYVSVFAPDSPVDGVLTAEFELMPTSAIERTSPVPA